MACQCAEGWVCEEHPEQPWHHDEACEGMGMRCSNPDCPWWRGPAPAALDMSEYSNRASVHPKPPRRSDH